MLRYAASETMLVDYVIKEHPGNFDLHIPKGQCAYVQFSDGREGFLESGDHKIRTDRAISLFRKAEKISMYWFNLSDHIELHLTDTVPVMEQMLKSVDPELKLFAPVDVNVSMDVSVRIEDREKLLQLMLERQEQEAEPVLDTEYLEEYLQDMLHYHLEEALNASRAQSGTGIFQLSSLSEKLECSLIGELCDLLESMSLELVAARISQIAPDQEGLEQFQKKEAETLSWYNQVQMDKFSRRKSSQVRKKKGFLK